ERGRSRGRARRVGGRGRMPGIAGGRPFPDRADPSRPAVRDSPTSNAPAINVGSTSLKHHLYEIDTEEVLASGVVERVGTAEARYRWQRGVERGESSLNAPDVKAARGAVLRELSGPDAVLRDASELTAVGHRVVHGGETLV